jgi:hypothetical protein
MLDGSKKNVQLTKKFSLENLKKEKPAVSNSNNKIFDTNLNTNSENYEWIFDIYIPNLIDLIEEHKKQVKNNLITDLKLDKVKKYYFLKIFHDYLLLI